MLVVLVGIAAALGLIVLYLNTERTRRASIAAALAPRFGVVQISSTWRTLELILERPAWSGVLRAHATPGRMFETIQVTGTTRTARGAWSITPRRFLLQPGPGALVPLADAELQRRFVVVAERPEEVRPFFDAEVKRLILGLDAGLAHSLLASGAGVAGVSVSVEGTAFHVLVSGQKDDAEEHLTRVLELIERVAQHGQP